MVSRIIHPRMLSTLGDFFPVMVTIQRPTETRNEIGEITSVWANVPGLVDLDGALTSTGGRESRQPREIYTRATHRVPLTSYYPGITEKMRAVISSPALTLDILLVEHDSQKQSTWLVCEVVR